MDENTVIFSYVVPFRFGKQIMYYDPSTNELLGAENLNDEAINLILQHVKSQVLPEENPDEDEILKNTYGNGKDIEND